MTALLPLAFLYGRGIEDIPDPSDKCRALCKIAEEIHNKELLVEMKKLTPLVEDASAGIKPTLDKVVDVKHVICVEEPLSIVERHKLRTLIRSTKAQNRVKHFSEFIKKFPEYEIIPEQVISEQIVRKITK